MVGLKRIKIELDFVMIVLVADHYAGDLSLRPQRSSFDAVSEGYPL